MIAMLLLLVPLACPPKPLELSVAPLSLKNLGPALETICGAPGFHAKVEPALVASVSNACEAIEAGTLGEAHLATLRQLREKPRVYERHLLVGEDVDTGRVADDSIPLEAGLTGIEARFIEGLSDFLVARAKQESLKYLQRQLAESLCSAKSRPYFEHTCRLVESMKTVSLATASAALQRTALADLESLPELAVSAISLDPTNFVDVTTARLILAGLRETRDGATPIDVVSSLRGLDDAALGCHADDCAAFIKSLRDAGAIVSAATAMKFSTPTTWRTNSTAKRMLVSSILEAELLGLHVVKADELTMMIGPVASALQSLAVVKKKTEELLEQERGDRSVLLLSATEALLAVASAAEPSRAKVLQRARALVHAATPLARAIVKRDPASIYVESTSFLVELVPTLPGDPRFVMLLVEIANATSSSDVAAALEVAAAPVGSYETKVTRWAPTINAYLGLAGGGEWVLDDALTSNNGGSPAGGGFAPVGIGYFGPVLDGHLSAGLFASVLDIGAVTTFRLEQEVTTESGDTADVPSIPNIGLAQVFSPGLYGVIGCKSPIAVGAGVSLGPELRSLKASGDDDAIETGTAVDALRASVFVALDLTLFSF